MNAEIELRTFTDYATDQEVRWCPGCGDYAILKAMQKTLAGLQAAPEKTVFVSGIGCSSRFPYYMATYGFHTIHGRAPAVATGIKLANPELDVWIITGDGDGLSIGANHLFHLLRRNLDVQILLFNNEIYGLTKGQYSPTSRTGLVTPSTPMGSVDNPACPSVFALGCGASFIARGLDTQVKAMEVLFKRARAHRGAAFVEIFQNCIVYNDETFADFGDKKVAAERQLNLQHGAPMLFGANRDRGLVFNQKTFALEVAVLGEAGVSESDILVHDETSRNLSSLLLAMRREDMPVPMGVVYAARDQPCFNEAIAAQSSHYPPGSEARSFDERLAEIDALLRNNQVWTVDEKPA